MRDGLLEKIYHASNDGLDIVLYYYPQATECVGKNKLFKIRGNENTASASLKKIKEIWRVTDFGDEGTAMSPIDICQREESVIFKEALFLLADRYNVSESIKASINKPDIKTRAAKKNEPEGHFDFKLKEKLSEKELALLGPTVKQKTCDKYSYFAVVSYAITKNRKTTTISSNENYPIFLRDCGEFKKIYQPLNTDKGFRFFYKGNKPKNYINGLDELRKAHRKFLDDQQSDPYEDENGIKPPKVSDKLPEAVICSGERDALSVAGHGYFPLWLNSESARLEPKEYAEISRMVEKIYNIPDADETGIKKGEELAMKYIDILTVKLPPWLSHYKDMRGKPRKDFRDFVELRPKLFDFKELLKMAKCCRFWDKKQRKDHFTYEINTINLIYFLKTNGFYTIVDNEAKKITYIRIEGYKVFEIIGKNIRDFIRNWMESSNIDLDLHNLVLNSKRVGTSVMDDLPAADLNFLDATYYSQTLFFNNMAIEVHADKIKEIRNREIENYVWNDKICEHRFKRIAPAFTAKFDKETEKVDFEINNTNSHYFKYIINASRIYWREELEQRKDGDEALNEKYTKDFRFSITGTRLEADEITDQAQNLMNKLFTIGYLMHSYKFASKALGVWIMENNLTESGASEGGSGKSFMIKILKNIKTIISLPGQNKKLTDNQHLFERISNATDVLNVDDAHQYFDFNYFYDMITGDMVLNEKHAKSKELDYSESPKLVISSNHPPPKNDSSTMRRLLLVVFSDYYHKSTSENNYRGQ